jgi:hypothetical protein
MLASAAGSGMLAAVPGFTLSLAYLLPDPEHSVPAVVVLAAGYLVAAALWLRTNRRAGASQNSFAYWWLLGAILLFALALNKVIDFRRVIELTLRGLGQAQGWYSKRRPAQFALAVLLPAVLAVFTTIYLATKGRAFLRSNPLALAGWLLLLLYLVLRQSQEWKPALPVLSAIRYHDWRLALEAGGIVLVALAALKVETGSPPAQK